jgi:hypothetical protein
MRLPEAGRSRTRAPILTRRRRKVSSCMRAAWPITWMSQRGRVSINQYAEACMSQTEGVGPETVIAQAVRVRATGTVTSLSRSGQSRWEPPDAGLLSGGLDYVATFTRRVQPWLGITSGRRRLGGRPGGEGACRIAGKDA